MTLSVDGVALASFESAEIEEVEESPRDVAAFERFARDFQAARASAAFSWGCSYR